MTDTQLNTYFLALATQLKEIAHDPEAKLARFARMDEVLSSKRSGFEASPGLVLSSESGKLAALGNGNALSCHECTFLVLRKCEVKDFDGYEKAFTETMAIGRKIIGRMLYDLKAGDGIMRYLDKDSIRFEKVGPVYDHAFGYAFTFLLKIKIACEFTYNPNDWL